MQGIIKAYNSLLQGMAVLSGVLIFASFLMIVVDVSMRIVGLKPPLFTVATVEYILLWFTMLAAPWLARIKGHVFIDAVTQFLPSSIKAVVAKIVHTICVVSCSIYAVHSYLLFDYAWERGLVDLRTVDMPQWIIYLPMPICFALVAIEFTRFLLGFDDMYDKRVADREGV